MLYVWLRAYENCWIIDFLISGQKDIHYMILILAPSECRKKGKPRFSTVDNTIKVMIAVM